MPVHIAKDSVVTDAITPHAPELASEALPPGKGVVQGRDGFKVIDDA